MYVLHVFSYVYIYIVTFYAFIIEHLGSYHILVIVSYVTTNTQCILSL